jgi:uncharacterized C2H2 Zn-finger protein
MSDAKNERELDPRLLKFCRALGELKDSERLFPKKCKTCSQQFRDLGEYVRKTVPKAHVFEDCSETMGRPFTMMYRHCSCGNTLVMTLTDELLGELEEMWQTLRKIAGESGEPLNTVVAEFSSQCDKHLASLNRDQGRA